MPIIRRPLWRFCLLFTYLFITSLRKRKRRGKDVGRERGSSSSFPSSLLYHLHHLHNLSIYLSIYLYRRRSLQSLETSQWSHDEAMQACTILQGRNIILTDQLNDVHGLFWFVLLGLFCLSIVCILLDFFFLSFSCFFLAVSTDPTFFSINQIFYFFNIVSGYRFCLYSFSTF